MKIDHDEDRNVHSPVKRLPLQREAKKKHAVLVNNYSSDLPNFEKGVKRRKTGNNDEIFIKSGSDTKIRLNPYAIENFAQEESNQHTYNDDNMQQFENEMNNNPELAEVCDNPRSFESIKEIEPSGIPDYYEPSELKLPQESIEDFMNSKHKIDDFKDFNMIGSELQVESQINLMSNNHDWKADSINFHEPRALRTIDKIKVETNEEGHFLKEPGPCISLIDQL